MLDIQQSHTKKLSQARQTTPPAARLEISKAEILRHYSLVVQSRETSIVGRREVLSGKAKFGIFGDGKELPQIAMAKTFQKGDFRSGYYRDQTFAFALGISDIPEFFAQIYANTDIKAEPHNAGRQMNCHFSTRSLNPDGSWRNLMQMYNSSADLAPTAAQMPRLVGHGYASKLYRGLDELRGLTNFSRNGNEVAFGTIGNGSCAEGLFWESVNAIGVLKVPVVLSIWDDGYGISVPNEFQITKQDISELLKGFQREPGSDAGFDIYTVKGWDYLALMETYTQAVNTARTEHIPVIIHVTELTQPQGHSTSGSHERYKSEEQLAWEKAHDCNLKFKEWIIEQRIASVGELDTIERNAKKLVENLRSKAWKAFSLPIYRERDHVASLVQALEVSSSSQSEISKIRTQFLRKPMPMRKDIMGAIQQVLVLSRADVPNSARQKLVTWKNEQISINQRRYGSHLTSESYQAADKVAEIKPIYAKDAPFIAGSKVLHAAFDAIFARDARVVAFGEDVGQLGGVNQTFAGLQEKYGELRVSDTGIREATIIGQAIGLAQRGLRPIAEIQYLDYILYALQTLSDDLATLHWRTAGGQKAPVIVSTRGHRLEGIWHSGSPMAGLIHLLRGMHILVPRDMTRAAGFYNTLLKGDNPALVIEVLNGYRLKERLPSNVGEMTIPLGVPEVLRTGEDVTIVTYGASCRIAMETAVLLQKVDIDVEVIDVQSLLPFDRNGRILESLKKTGRIIFLDEDVPGGTTAYMMQEVIEKQGGYHWLDSEPRTLAAQPHRPAYGTDGGYFSKPSVENVFDAVYELMNEVEPAKYPNIYK